MDCQLDQRYFGDEKNASANKFINGRRLLHLRLLEMPRHESTYVLMITSTKGPGTETLVSKGASRPSSRASASLSP